MATDSDFKTGKMPPPRPPDGGASSSGLSEPKIPAQARSACEAHRECIESQIRLGRNATAIYQDLVDQHQFKHAYNSVKRFVRALRRKEPEHFDRLEFLPGDAGDHLSLDFLKLRDISSPPPR